MTDMEQGQLDLIFKALSDQVRRDVLKKLTNGPLAINELAAPYDMSLPAVSKHIKVLERASLISCTKIGRTQYCQIKSGSIYKVDRWLTFYRDFWEQKLDNLEAFALENK